MKLWLVKRSYNRVLMYEQRLVKFQTYIKKIKTWKKDEIKKFNKNIYELSSIDFEEFQKNFPEYKK